MLFDRIKLPRLRGDANHKSMRASSVLVPVTGDDCDEDVVRIACEMLESRRSLLRVLYVIEVARHSPIDAEIAEDYQKGEAALRRMEQVANSYNCMSEARLMQARKAGAVIVRESIDKNVDAIVMGASQTESFGVFSLGEHIPYVLRHAPCRVIIYRDPKLAASGGAAAPRLTGAKRAF